MDIDDDGMQGFNAPPVVVGANAAYVLGAVQLHPNGGQFDVVCPPHVRPMGVHRTRGEPNEIRKNVDPKRIINKHYRTFFFVEQSSGDGGGEGGGCVRGREAAEDRGTPRVR